MSRELNRLLRKARRKRYPIDHIYFRLGWLFCFVFKNEKISDFFYKKWKKIYGDEAL